MLEIIFYLTESELTLDDVLAFAAYARDPVARTAIIEVEHFAVPNGRVLVVYVVYGGYRVTDTEITELLLELLNEKNKTE